MLRRVHPRTVNPIPLGKQSWFDSKLLHQVDDLDIRLNALANVQSGVKPVSFKVRSYNGHYLGLSIRRREFDSPTHRQVLKVDKRKAIRK